MNAAAPVFADLDETLVYSARVWGAAPGTVVVDRSGDRPVSVATAGTVRALDALATAGQAIVPASARSLEQYRRMTLFRVEPSTAILAGGALVLRDGSPDPGWQDELASLTKGSASTPDILALLKPLGRAGAEPTVRSGRLIVVARDDSDSAAAFTLDAEVHIADAGWSARADGRRCYLMPTVMTKGRAAAYLVRESAAPGWYAAGDSLLDADLIGDAIAGIVPAHGALAVAGSLNDTTTVTRSRGPDAAEEICRWIESTIPRGDDLRGNEEET